MISIILVLFDLVSCISLAGQIDPRIHDKSQIRVLINGGEFVSQVTRNGDFKFEIPIGNHLMEVSSNDYFFEKVKLQVGLDDHGHEQVKASVAFTGMEWGKDGPLLQTPLILIPRLEYKYESEPPKFSIWSILGNPMILMSVIPLALLLIMPKMIENMDPETLKEFQEAQKLKASATKQVEMPDVSQTLANWFVPNAQVSAQSSSNVENGSSSNAAKLGKKKK